MRGKWGPAVVALVLTALVSGCTDGVVGADAQGDRPAGGPSAERRHEARLHLPAEPISLDPARATDPVAFDVLGNLLEGLVRTGDGGIVRPGVAERWETAGRQITFHLRRDARWSDGRSVTADDFVHAWQRLLDPRTGSGHAYLLYEVTGAQEWNTLDPASPTFAKRSAELARQVGVAATDEHTLLVTLRTAQPDWVRVTAHPALAPQRTALIAKLGHRYGTPGEFLANGPFTLEQWHPGESIILRRNPAYWDVAAVRLERVQFRIERDGQAALRLLGLGELDQAYLPGDLAVGRADARTMAQPAVMALVFQTRTKPLDSQHLRQAIHLAINRRRLVDETARGAAIPSEGLIPPSLGTTVGQIPPEGQPLVGRQHWDLARQELRVDSLTLRLLHTDETAAMARSLQAMLQQNLPGLTIEREQVTVRERVERVRAGQFELALQGWLADWDDPLTMLAPFTTDAPGNDPRWSNPDFDQLITQLRRGQVSREVALIDAERLLLGELPVLPLYHPVRHWAASPRVSGVLYRPWGARIDLKTAFVP